MAELPKRAEPLVVRLHDLVIIAGQARARTPALQPARRPALRSFHYQFVRSWYWWYVFGASKGAQRMCWGDETCCTGI
jgi:hypothetical protein